MDVAVHQFQYPGSADAQVVVYATAKNAAAGLAKAVTEAAAAAIKEKGSFTLVLSGGWGVLGCAGMAGVCSSSSGWRRVVLNLARVLPLAPWHHCLRPPQHEAHTHTH
jgi:hypothetical protein